MLSEAPRVQRITRPRFTPASAKSQSSRRNSDPKMRFPASDACRSVWRPRGLPEQARVLRSTLLFFGGKCDHNLKLSRERPPTMHETRPRKTAGSKKRAFERSTGSAGGPIFPSGSGERSARIIARGHRLGIFSTRSRALPRVSLGGRRHRRHQRPSPNDLLWAGVMDGTRFRF